MRKCCVIMLCFCIVGAMYAQAPYKRPPQDVVDIVEADPTPRDLTSPSGKMMALIGYEAMPSIATMAQPVLRLAGRRIMPRNNSRQTTIFYTGISLVELRTGKTRQIDLPEGSLWGFPRWSFDDEWIAFTRTLDDHIELWVIQTETGQMKRLTALSVNTTLTNGFTWMSDSRHILVHTIPEGRGDPPEAPNVPIGPTIQETSGKVAKEWTYQDLLTNAYDEALFDYYATSQIVKVDVVTGESSPLGTPGIYTMSESSPDGAFILIRRINRPYSYMVPYYRFPHTVDLWDPDGRFLRNVADLPLADEVPMRGVPTGPRSVSWRSSAPATLFWIEALDDGNPENDVPNRDRMMKLSVTFDNEPEEVIRLQHRFAGIEWLEDGRSLITEYDWKRRWRTTFLMNIDRPDVLPVSLFDLSIHDRYNDPGLPMTKTASNGEEVVIQDRDWIYLRGSGASPEGDRPFLDRFNLRTKATQRLYHCDEKSYEWIIGFVNNSRSQIITSYETKTDPPNYYRVHLRSKMRSALTSFPDPAPQLTGVRKQLLKYKRNDGVQLSGTLYLPPGYTEGERLPLILWAYPREYSDPRVAGQVRGSPHRFTFLRGTSQRFFITQGYALLDGAQMPVVGDPNTMNDTFIEQIIASARAAIDTLDQMGIIDPERVGVGGHSYGAFMTGNLLAHCDLFAAGIARSGAYNRTLTPFGFQSERRSLWEVPDFYFKVSPFMHADKINEPILLIHGEMDNNSGTFPIQSKRLYHALKGHGETVRFVLLPNESHGYRAKESVLHVLWEMFEWMDKYVKNR